MMMQRDGFIPLRDTPRRFATPLLIEGISCCDGLDPLYEEGCPTGRGV